ncbi:MAG TPA: bifunctional alpha,alpha-trehalose-phosphate synthase (UDP-forming)/trehalose-phosphatase [Chitinophagaceae bacterium]
MARLLVISNRAPFSIDKVGEDIVVRQSSGGLVSALKSYFEKKGSGIQAFERRIWIGSVDASPEDWQVVEDMGAIQEDFELAPVFINREVYEAYYNGFSNSTLWPLFHYFPSLVEVKKEYWDAYVKANDAFVDKILSVYQEGDIIWVHDYQLMLLPQMIRDRLPEASIGFFLHIPFPSYEIFRLLPTGWKKDLLKGLLGADLIGFHTHDYVQHFIQSAKMILSVENQFNTIHYQSRVIKADLFPIGIDYQKFRDQITNDLVANISTSLEERFFNQKIIFSVDRLDYTKGLSYRLQGFEEFLERNPEWREKVVFILNVVPSREFIPTYAERRKEIEERVSAINGKFSTLQWQPLIYRYNHLDFDELCALYQSADVALITPLRDGMNLVAKEYIASCIDKGVLVLSELTGAASELNEALLVNPTDSGEVADAIATALSMPIQEQRTRLSYMQKRLAEYNVEKWINDFLDTLKAAREEQRKQQVNVFDNAAISQMMEEFQAAGRRCILLDYDGTLAPYQKLPTLATPGKELLDLLRQLSDDPLNEVVIISGRDADTLDKWLGSLPLSLVAEHGALIKYKNGEWQQQVTVSPEWKESIRPLLELFVTRCVGSFIEEKGNTLAWHYRNTHPDLGFNRSRELRNSLLQLTTNTPLQVIDGNKVLEVRLMGIDKGATAKKLVRHFQPDFILCIGDDTTDEDMFRVLRDEAYTVKIGSGGTAAKYTLLSQIQVLPLLRKLLLLSRKETFGHIQT